DAGKGTVGSLESPRQGDDPLMADAAEQRLAHDQSAVGVTAVLGKEIAIAIGRRRTTCNSSPGNQTAGFIGDAKTVKLRDARDVGRGQMVDRFDIDFPVRLELSLKLVGKRNDKQIDAVESRRNLLIDGTDEIAGENCNVVFDVALFLHQ